MLKKIPLILILIVVACNSAAQQFRSTPEAAKLEQVLRHIQAFYVDEVDTEALVQAAIRAMLNELDQYSVFNTVEETREMNEAMQGTRTWYGIGISFNMATDTINIGEVISGGPAHQVGLLPGDRIISVNDTIVSGVQMNQQEVVGRLRGPRGVPVNIQVLRRGVPELLNFRIVRDRIPYFSIDASYMVTDDIGYIRISRFAATTPREFREAQQALKAQGMQHLILDLTDNTGGILQVAPEIAGEFLEANRLVVYMEGRAQPRIMLHSTRGGNMLEGRVVVLVNESSASASEILAGALQDWDRAVIVGRRTFGKGTVQRQIPLPDESMIRLTIARYYTPIGRSVQRLYDIGNLAAYNQDPVNLLLRGEFIDNEEAQFPDSLKFTTLVNQRTVFGGGGITPDYFVPRDMTEAIRLHRELRSRGTILFTAVDEVDSNREELMRRFPDATAFQNNFRVPASMVNELRSRIESENVEWCDEEFAQSSDFIFRELRTIMARQLYDSSASTQIWNEGNNIFQEGLRIISDPERHENLLRGIGSNVGTRELIPPPAPPRVAEREPQVLHLIMDED